MPAARIRTLGAVAVALYVAACVASYAKADVLTNDFERFDDLRLTVLFFALFAGLSGIYVGLVGWATGPGRRLAWIVAGLCAVPLLAAFPVGSRDVFAYAFFGKMWGLYGVNPYLEPPSLVAHDAWFPFLQAWWKDTTITYGPLFTYQSRIIYGMAGNSVVATVGAYKAVNVPLLAAAAWLLAAIGGEMEGGAGAGPGRRDRTVLLWLWSPLVLFESLGSGHNDLAMTVLVLVAVLSWLRGWWAVSVVFLGLSIWYKWYSVVLLPVWVAWSARRWGVRVVGRLAAGTLLFALLSALVLLPLRGTLAPTMAHILSHRVAHLLFPTELPPPLWVVFQAYAAAGVFGRAGGEAIFAWTRLALMAGGVAFLLWRRWSAAYRPSAFIEDLVWTLVVFFFCAVSALYPWHLLPVCALGLATGDVRYERGVAALTAMGLLSYFLTFTVALLLCALVTAAVLLLRMGDGRRNGMGGAPAGPG